MNSQKRMLPEWGPKSLLDTKIYNRPSIRYVLPLWHLLRNRNRKYSDHIEWSYARPPCRTNQNSECRHYIMALQDFRGENLKEKAFQFNDSLIKYRWTMDLKSFRDHHQINSPLICDVKGIRFNSMNHLLPLRSLFLDVVLKIPLFFFFPPISLIWFMCECGSHNMQMYDLCVFQIFPFHTAHLENPN